MMGTPPATLASKAMARPCLRAASNTSAPCCARSALLAVTTSLPAASSASTACFAQPMPPTSSTAICTPGSRSTCCKSVVISSRGSGTGRGFEASRTTTRRNTQRPAGAGRQTFGLFQQQSGHAAADGAAANKSDAERFVHRCQSLYGVSFRGPLLKYRNTDRTRTDAAADGWRPLLSRVLYQIHVSITSAVNTSPCSRNSWSFSQVVQRLLQRAGRLGHLGQFLRFQIVNVLVERLARLHLVLDAVEHGHQHRREGQVGIARAVRTAELDALGLPVRRVDRNANRRRAIAAAVGEIDRRLVAGHQTLVTVGGRIGDGAQRRRVPQQAADGVHGHGRTGRRSRSRRTGSCRPSTSDE